MNPENRAFDFDFIVIGSGFGGSVAAYRGTEGVPRRGDGNGAALASTRLSADQLVVASLVLAAEVGVAWIFQHAFLSSRHHPAWLRGRRRLHHLCGYVAAGSGQDLG